MTVFLKDKKNGDVYNIIFLVFIVLSLFVALTYAITESSRGGETLERENIMIAASQINQYPSIIHTAINDMILTGVELKEVDFTYPPKGRDYEVFALIGGGVSKTDPPQNIGINSDSTKISSWGFKDIKNKTKGYYVYSIGSNEAVSGRDVIAYLRNITLAVCEQVNKGIGISIDPIPLQNIPVNYNLPLGGEGPAFSGGNAYTFGAKPGIAFACFKNGNKGYDYYHVLAKQ